MTILVFGASGLLGSTLCKLYDGQVTPVYRTDCDLRDERQIRQFFYTHDPEYVINCAGDTNRSEFVHPDTYLVNMIAPHVLAKYCGRLIHISTDCVFAGGGSGYYDELDTPNGTGHYALSKRMGEVRTYPHLTIRTSFVGLPDPKCNGLLHWFSQQKRVDGYKNVLWNGLTTVELSHKIMTLLKSNKRGVLHVFGKETISKYDLLCTVRDVYGWDIEINPVEEPVLNKTLETVYLDFSNVVEKPFKQMVQEMKDAFG
jgi:dTDP-4-dehydrorhamnose reductase